MIFQRTEHKRKALIADDDAGTLELFRFLLNEEGWDVVEARSGEEVVARTVEENPEVLVLDNRMPGCSGTEAYGILKSMGVSVPAILVSGVDDAKKEAARAGIRYSFQKPVDVTDLLNALEQACGAA